MATAYLNLWNTGALAGALSHTYYNDAMGAIDRLGRGLYEARVQGAVSGWRLPAAAGVSRITQGKGLVGPQLLVTTASATISGLQNGTNYIHVVAAASAGWAGGIAAKARTTSAPLLNTDGTSSGIILGKVTRNALTGVTAGSADSTLRQPAYSYRWHKQTETVSLTAGPTTATSVAMYWSTKVGCPTIERIPSGTTSQVLRCDTLTASGAVLHLYNKNSNAAYTLNKTLTIRGFIW